MRGVNFVTTLILVVIAGVLGYVVGASRSNSTAPTTNTISDAVTSAESKTDIKFVTLSEQNNSGEAGVAVLRSEDGKVKVNLKLVGAPETEQPAHIHSGGCPSLGAIVYNLTPVVDGSSEIILNVTLDEIQGKLPLAINVHESAANIQNYVACGNLPD